jgi:hypothetical protein
VSDSQNSYHIATFGGEYGKIYVTYVPEYNSVTFTASVPSDRRKSDINVRVSGAKALREMVEKLETRIELEERRRKSQEGVSEGDDGVFVSVKGTKVQIAQHLFDQISECVKNGDNDGVLRAIKSELPWMGDKGASEMAYALYRYLRRND